MDDQTILICDDDPAIRRLIATVLRGEGYRFDEAEDVPSALEKLESLTPRLVLLDVNIPGDGGGMGILAHIRQSPLLSNVRVLLVTGIVEAYEDPAWGRSAGADGHVLKPFEMQGLRDAVRAVVTDAAA